MAPQYTVTSAILVSSRLVSRYLPRYRKYRTTSYRANWTIAMQYGLISYWSIEAAYLQILIFVKYLSVMQYKLFITYTSISGFRNVAFITTKHSTVQTSAEDFHVFYSWLSIGIAIVNIWMSPFLKSKVAAILTLRKRKHAFPDLSFCDVINKKAQLSLTNPRDACEKFVRFT